MEITITGQSVDGIISKPFDKAREITELALSAIVVRGAVVHYPATMKIKIYVLRHPLPDQVKAALTNLEEDPLQPYPLEYLCMELDVQQKNYTCFEDVLANVKRHYDNFDADFDIHPVFGSKTITATWGHRLCTLLADPVFGKKIGGRRFNYDQLARNPVVNYTSQTTRADLPRPANMPDNLYQISCASGLVVHLRKEPIVPAAAKLILTNTHLHNSMTPGENGKPDVEEYVVKMLRGPDPTGYDVHVAEAELDWKKLGDARRKNLVFKLMWTDGQPLLFDTRNVLLGLKVR